MKHRAFALALTVAAIVTPALAGEPRAVIELFTSQGCSSCPAADKLLGQLRQDPSVLALSLPVDYWDYLGWKDTLALHGHTVRQQAYAQSRGDREVYTPQVVVNGMAQVLGSDRSAIESAIKHTAKQAGTLSLPVAVSVADNQISVNVPADKGTVTKGEIWLCPITKNVPVAVGKGENSGNTITYHNVVRKWIKLGEWTGAARSFTLPVRDLGDDEAESVAVIIQAGSKEAPGAMLGANVSALK